MGVYFISSILSIIRVGRFLCERRAVQQLSSGFVCVRRMMEVVSAPSQLEIRYSLSKICCGPEKRDLQFSTALANSSLQFLPVSSILIPSPFLPLDFSVQVAS